MEDLTGNTCLVALMVMCFQQEKNTVWINVFFNWLNHMLDGFQ